MGKDVLQYEDICRMLKRYSFSEKMRICNVNSRKLMEISGCISIDKVQKYALCPWELETFLLLSIKASPEYQDKNFIGKNYNVFVKMINGIKNYDPVELIEKSKDNEFLMYVLCTYGLLEFDIQEFVFYKMFRFNYIFNYCDEKIDMKSIFYKFYKTDYREFVLLGGYLTMLYGSNIPFGDNILNFITKNICPNAFNKLVITVEDYKKELDNITNDIKKYVTCLRPSYKYPFIEYSNYIYLPLPHLLGRSVTSSLLYRLTDNNSKLRELVGKNILEKYLYEILFDSNIYDEIYPEQQFKIAHNQPFKTLDILIRKDDDFLFLDSKTSVPNSGLRICKEDVFNREIDRTVKNIVQIYKHLRLFLPKYEEKYNIFKDHPVIKKENLFGITVQLEDNFLRRDLLFNKAAKELNIEKSPDEVVWMKKHIKVTNLYDIECCSIVGNSLIEVIKNKNSSGCYTDMNLFNNEGEKHIVNEKYKLYRSRISDGISSMTEMLLNAGLLKKNID